jgi:hypothetical protein
MNWVSAAATVCLGALYPACSSIGNAAFGSPAAIDTTGVTCVTELLRLNLPGTARHEP